MLYFKKGKEKEKEKGKEVYFGSLLEGSPRRISFHLLFLSPSPSPSPFPFTSFSFSLLLFSSTSFSFLSPFSLLPSMSHLHGGPCAEDGSLPLSPSYHTYFLPLLFFLLLSYVIFFFSRLEGSESSREFQ